MQLTNIYGIDRRINRWSLCLDCFVWCSDASGQYWANVKIDWGNTGGYWGNTEGYWGNTKWFWNATLSDGSVDYHLWALWQRWSHKLRFPLLIIVNTISVNCQHNISQSIDAEEAFCCINLILICIKMKLISFTFAAAIFIQSPCLPVSIPAGGSLPIGEVQPLSFQSTDLTTFPFGTVLTNQSNESQLIPKCALVQFNTEPVCLSMRLNQFWRDTNAPPPRPWNYIFQRTDTVHLYFLCSHSVNFEKLKLEYTLYYTICIYQ